MMTGDMLPLSFVEGEGFRELMAFVEPEYKLPSQRTTTTKNGEDVRGKHGELEG
uniref:Uncharacterized protein n=1 Tax=Anguilla anguilla TaxID=7936 RepID=A0A0E9RVE7_ANGAN